jgi:hypothetical protein
MLRAVVPLSIVLTVGCTTLTLSDSQIVASQLKIRSAGFTGCAVEANQITNATTNLDGSGTWNVTCKDKVYLCSQGSSSAPSYSCAIAVN